MKIVYALYKFPKLSETFIVHQIYALIDKGHEVYIIACIDPKEELIHPVVDEYGLRGKTCYIKRSKDEYGFEITTELVELLIECDVIHAHFATWATEFAHIISQIADIPYLFTIHAYDLFRDGNFETLNKMIEKARGVITVSDFNRNFILENIDGAYESKIKVIHCGIDLKKTVLTEPVKHDDGIIRILIVGRFIEKKGISYAISAFAELCNQYENLELRIIGEGPLRDNIMQLIAGYNIEDKVLLLGNKVHEEVVRELAISDIFLLPSVTAMDGDREGIPVSILEAQAMEVPVVSTLHTGIPEAVLNNVTGFLVPERDSKAIVEKLEILVLSESQRRCMGKQGRRVIEEQFTHEDEIDALENLMKTVVSAEGRTDLRGERIWSFFTALEKQKQSMNKQWNDIIQAKNNRIAELEGFANRIKKSLPYRVYTKLSRLMGARHRSS